MAMKRTLILTPALVLCSWWGSPAGETPPPIPRLSDWERAMTDNARIVANQPTQTDSVNLHEEHLWYCDGLAIFHQIAQYTKDKRWLDVCAKCRSYYRDSCRPRPRHDRYPGG
jgi:hypothetical protein